HRRRHTSGSVMSSPHGTVTHRDPLSSWLSPNQICACHARAKTTNSTASPITAPRRRDQRSSTTIAAKPYRPADDASSPERTIPVARAADLGSAGGGAHQRRSGDDADGVGMVP